MPTTNNNRYITEIKPDIDAGFAALKSAVDVSKDSLEAATTSLETATTELTQANQNASEAIVALGEAQDAAEEFKDIAVSAKDEANAARDEAVAAKDIVVPLAAEVATSAEDVAETAGFLDSVVTTSSELVSIDDYAVQEYTGNANAIARGGSSAFFGWGSNFNSVSTDTFNVGIIPELQRAETTVEAEKWAKIVYNVYDGPFVAESPAPNIIATAEVDVDPEATTIGPLTFLLTDPVTGAFKTISGADQPTIHGRGHRILNADGDLIGGGEIRATQPDFAGESFYFNAAGNMKAAGGNLSYGYGTRYRPGLRLEEKVVLAPNVEFERKSTLSKFALLLSTGYAKAIGYMGDSWATNTLYGFDDLKLQLKQAGVVISPAPGYISANIQQSVPEGGLRNRSGTWTDVRFTGTSSGSDEDGGFGPDGAESIAEAGALLRVGLQAGLGDARSFKINYTQRPEGGGFTYVAGDVTGSVDATGTEEVKILEVAANAQFIEVTMTSQTKINGIEPINGSGLRVSKLGNGGATAQRPLDIPAEFFKTGLAALELDVILIVLGTNDNIQDVGVDVFKANITTLVGRIKEALPDIEICLVGPGPNNHPNAVEHISNYNIKMEEVAAENEDVYYTSIEKMFGDYETARAAGLMGEPTDPHPLTTIDGGSGGIAIGRILFNAFFRDAVDPR